MRGRADKSTLIKAIAGVQPADRGEYFSTGVGDVANVFHIADRIVVLRLGRRVATFDRWATTPAAVVAEITGAGAPA